jgi:hypothetical protein
MKEKDIVGACSIHREDEKRTQILFGIFQRRGLCSYLGVHRVITGLKEMGWEMWTGFSWLKRSSGNGYFVFFKKKEISWPANQLSALL